MENRVASVSNTLKLIGFIAYFSLLFVERLLAVIFSVNSGGEYALTSGNAFNYFAYTVTVLSLAAGTALFVRLFVQMGRAHSAGENYRFDDHAKEWSIAASAHLFGGMMHTGFTLAGLQFAAYGFLIAAMIVKCCLSGEDRFLTIVSTVYLTLFSMSIPVCYLSFMASPMLSLFFTAQAAAVFVLVPIFGIMLSQLMKEGVTSFTPYFPAAMCLLSGATIVLKWQEEINWFVLIFAALTILFYGTFGILALRRQGKES